MGKPSSSSTVVDLDDRIESRFPPLHSFEVENNEIALWQVVHERVETMSSIWLRAGLRHDRWDATANKVRSMKAEEDWHRDGGKWLRTLASITTARSEPGWRMPLVRNFDDLQSLGIALGGCLLWHALQEQVQLNRDRSLFDGAMISWRTWIYLRWRRHVEHLLARNRIQSKSVALRVSPLINGDGHRFPDKQCGYLIEVWPLTARNVRFTEGFERVRARVLLDQWSGDVPGEQRELILAYSRRMY